MNKSDEQKKAQEKELQVVIEKMRDSDEIGICAFYNKKTEAMTVTIPFYDNLFGKVTNLMKMQILIKYVLTRIQREFDMLMGEKFKQLSGKKLETATGADSPEIKH